LSNDSRESLSLNFRHFTENISLDRIKFENMMAAQAAKSLTYGIELVYGKDVVIKIGTD